jgi:hypothetical protein
VRQSIPILLLAVAGIVGCGVGSVAPVVTDNDIVDDSRLVGTWKGDKESAVFTSTGRGTFDLLYTDEAGKIGQFHARLGQLGSHRVVDIQPREASPETSDIYKNLSLRAHGLLVLDSLTDAVQFRLLEPDSIKALLKRNPQAVAHTLVEEGVLVTASSSETRRFFSDVVQRKGFLSEATLWRRDSRAR